MDHHRAAETDGVHTGGAQAVIPNPGQASTLSRDTEAQKTVGLGSPAARPAAAEAQSCGMGGH